LDVPSDAHAWSEIVVIAVEWRSESETYLRKSRRRVWIEVANQAVALLHDSVDFVAQTKVHSECRLEAPFILQENGVAIVAQVP
jgi:hypothetical protein